MNIVGISGLDNSVPFKQRELPQLSRRFDRIAQGLDSAAALVTSDGIHAAAAEERFTGEKGTGAFPARAIDYCLKSAGLAVTDIDYLAHGFSYEPYRSLYEQSESTFTRRQFAEVYSRAAQIESLERRMPGVDWDRKLVQVPHHLAHAASAFYASDFDEALILVADGMGELDSTTVAVGTRAGIKVVERIRALHSLGILYSVFTFYLGFHMNLDEYKVMGLAPYGDPRRYFDQMMTLVSLRADGTYRIPLLFKNDTLVERETYGGTVRELIERFGPAREPEEEISQRHMDVAAALQSALQASLLHILRHFKKQTDQKNLCMAGGVALNCTANGVIGRSRMFRGMFVQPASGDDGSALGAALYVRHAHEPDAARRPIGLPLWGPSYDNDAIARALGGRTECESTFFESADDLVRDVARRLGRGEIVGWFQGRMEFGPRALGSRTILGDPRHPGMRDRINRLVKKREAFRPFAPAVVLEAAAEYFEMKRGDEALYAAMLFVTRVREAYRKQLPAVTHVDGSARVQTVAKDSSPLFWSLLTEFGRIGGVPILLNTSFNVRGRPIVRTPCEAIDTFLSARLDALAIGNYLAVRK